MKRLQFAICTQYLLPRVNRKQCNEISSILAISMNVISSVVLMTENCLFPLLLTTSNHLLSLPITGLTVLVQCSLHVWDNISFPTVLCGGRGGGPAPARPGSGLAPGGARHARPDPQSGTALATATFHWVANILNPVKICQNTNGKKKLHVCSGVVQH